MIQRRHDFQAYRRIRALKLDKASATDGTSWSWTSKISAPVVTKGGRN